MGSRTLKKKSSRKIHNKVEHGLSYQAEFQEYRNAVGCRSYEKYSGAIQNAQGGNAVEKEDA